MRAFARRDLTGSMPCGVASDRFGGIFAQTPRGQPPAAERRFQTFVPLPRSGEVRPEAAIRLSYSITSSARARIEGGIVMPSSAAVLRFKVR